MRLLAPRHIAMCFSGHLPALAATLVAFLATLLAPPITSGAGGTYVAQWARSVGSSAGGSTFRGIAADHVGGAFAVGTIRGTDVHDFGDGVVARSISPFNAVLVKYGSSGRAEWARTVYRGPGNSGFAAVAVDSADDIYAVGYIGEGGFDFGNGVESTGSGYATAVIVKYNKQDDALWSRSVSQPGGGSQYSALSIDEIGNVYAVGSIAGDGTYQIGNGVAVSGGASWANGTLFANSLVVKYDSSGAAMWAKSVRSANSDSEFTSVSVRASSVFVAGYAQENKEYDFGGGVKSTGGVGANLVLVNYDSEGNAQWVRTVVSDWGIGGNLSIAQVPLGGDVYSAGSLAGVIRYDFGHGFSPTGAMPNCWVAIRYNSLGVVKWLRSDPRAKDSAFLGLSVDNVENMFAVGWVGSTVKYDFGNSVSIPGGPAEGKGVVICFDSKGRTTWARSVNACPRSSRFYAVAADQEGNVFVVGDVSGTGDFDFGDGIKVEGTSADDAAAIAKWSIGS